VYGENRPLSVIPRRNANGENAASSDIHIFLAHFAYLPRTQPLSDGLKMFDYFGFRFNPNSLLSH
jgi:hypothetical protein